VLIEVQFVGHKVFMVKPPTMNNLTNQHQKRLNYLGSFIRNYRMNIGMTQYELSDCADSVHRNTLVRLEAGKNISLIKLFEVLDALELEPHELFLDVD
jgi:DNA-binding XRE family transcriptional regulator